MKLGSIRLLFMSAAALLVIGGPAIAQEMTAGLTPARMPSGYVAAMGQDYTPQVQGRGVDAVQNAVNRNAYVPDGPVDTWNPAALWERGGDCEDFAVAKIRELQAQGFKDLFFLVVKGKRTGQSHAVALVEAGGVWYVLDNQHTNKWPLRKFLDVWELQYVIDVDGKAAFQHPLLRVAHAD